MLSSKKDQITGMLAELELWGIGFASFVHSLEFWSIGLDLVPEKLPYRSALSSIKVQDYRIATNSHSLHHSSDYEEN